MAVDQLLQQEIKDAELCSCNTCMFFILGTTFLELIFLIKSYLRMI